MKEIRHLISNGLDPREFYSGPLIDYSSNVEIPQKYSMKGKSYDNDNDEDKTTNGKTNNISAEFGIYLWSKGQVVQVGPAGQVRYRRLRRRQFHQR